jgi:predicted metal-dependent HD superfamily phosphohydrolase
MDTARRFYDAAPRPYHSWRHVRAVLGALNRSLGQDLPPALLHAALWHDAIYDPKAADNEEKSAEVCEAHLREIGASEEIVSRAVALILSTKKHLPLDDQSDSLALLDADLWILGASERVYNRYAKLIRQEYAHVPEDAYRKGRTAVLGKFLKREKIYFGSGPDVAVREARARENLTREIDELLEREAEVG